MYVDVQDFPFFLFCYQISWSICSSLIRYVCLCMYVIVFMYSVLKTNIIKKKKCLNDVVMRVKCSNLINYLSSKQFFYWIFVTFVVVAAFFLSSHCFPLICSYVKRYTITSTRLQTIDTNPILSAV